MFENKLVKEVPIGSRPVTMWPFSPTTTSPSITSPFPTITRAFTTKQGAWSSRISNSLNGTFVNDLRVERATLHDGDSIWIGKHNIKVDATGDAAIPWDSGRKAAAPKINETMVLDTKARRDMLQQAAAMGERSQFSPGRLKMPTLVVLSGKVDQKEYVITNRLTVIGKSPMATIRLRGWFKPKMAAQINQRDDGYYLGTGDKIPTVNGTPISGTVRLNDGDLIDVCGVRLNFIFRE